MAKYIVTAQATIRREGLEEVFSLVSAVTVNDESGLPVTGLSKSNFRIYAASTQLIPLTIDQFAEPDLSKTPGLYLLLADYTVAAVGGFLFVFTVSKSAKKGYTIASAVKLE